MACIIDRVAVPRGVLPGDDLASCCGRASGRVRCLAGARDIGQGLASPHDRRFLARRRWRSSGRPSTPTAASTSSPVGRKAASRDCISTPGPTRQKSLGRRSLSVERPTSRTPCSWISTPTAGPTWSVRAKAAPGRSSCIGPPRSRSNTSTQERGRASRCRPSHKAMMWMFCVPVQVDGRGGVDLVGRGEGQRGGDRLVRVARESSAVGPAGSGTRIGKAGWIHVPGCGRHGRRRRPRRADHRSQGTDCEAAAGWKTRAPERRRLGLGETTSSAGRTTR